MWRATVAGLMNSSSPTSRLLWPAAIKRSTSRSRAVKPCGEAGETAGDVALAASSTRSAAAAARASSWESARPAAHAAVKSASPSACAQLAHDRLDSGDLRRRVRIAELLAQRFTGAEEADGLFCLAGRGGQPGHALDAVDDVAQAPLGHGQGETLVQHRAGPLEVAEVDRGQTHTGQNAGEGPTHAMGERQGQGFFLALQCRGQIVLHALNLAEVVEREDHQLRRAGFARDGEAGLVANAGCVDVAQFLELGAEIVEGKRFRLAVADVSGQGQGVVVMDDRAAKSPCRQAIVPAPVSRCSRSGGGAAWPRSRAISSQWRPSA